MTEKLASSQFCANITKKQARSLFENSVKVFFLGWTFPLNRSYIPGVCMLQVQPSTVRNSTKPARTKVSKTR